MDNVLVKPYHLQEGDKVVILTPSFPGPALYPRRFSRAIRALKEVGLDPLVPLVSEQIDGHYAGPASVVAKAFNDAVVDPSVRGILFSIGGYNTNRWLHLVDYDAVRHNPKVIVGYSDVCALLSAVYTCSGLVTFHGPTVMAEWGEYPQPLNVTSTQFVRATFSSGALGRLPVSSVWTDEWLEWASGEDETRPRTLITNQGWVTIRSGQARGRLFGGNLDTLCAMLGTPYFPTSLPDQTIWFIEPCSLTLPQMDRCLVQLWLAGAFKNIVGLLVGRLHGAENRAVSQDSSMFHKWLQEFTDIIGQQLGRSFPILCDLDLGHSAPMLTLPIGVMAEMDAALPSVTVIESATVAQSASR